MLAFGYTGESENYYCMSIHNYLNKVFQSYCIYGPINSITGYVYPVALPIFHHIPREHADPSIKTTNAGLLASTYC